MDSTVPLNNAIANDEKLSALIAQANVDYDSLLPGEQIRLRHIYYNYFNLWHSAFWNYEENRLPHYAWRLWNNGMGGLLEGQVAARRAWEDIHEAYDEVFQAHVASIMEQVGTGDVIGNAVPTVRNNVT